MYGNDNVRYVLNEQVKQTGDINFNKETLKSVQLLSKKKLTAEVIQLQDLYTLPCESFFLH